MYSLSVYFLLWTNISVGKVRNPVCNLRHAFCFWKLAKDAYLIYPIYIVRLHRSPHTVKRIGFLEFLSWFGAVSYWQKVWPSSSISLIRPLGHGCLQRKLFLLLSVLCSHGLDLHSLTSSLNCLCLSLHTFIFLSSFTGHLKARITVFLNCSHVCGP